MTEEEKIEIDDTEAEETEFDPMNPSKLTKWANEPTLSQLKKNLEDADPSNNEHVKNVNKWLDNLYIEGEAKIKTAENSSSVQPKLIRKQAEWRYAALSEPFLSTPDLFNIYPVTAGDTKRAIQNALVLNNQFNTKIRKVRFIDEFVRDNVDIGTAVIKVGWLTDEEEIEIEEPEIQFVLDPTGQLAMQYQELIQLQQTDPEQFENINRPGVEQALQMFIETGQAYFPQPTGNTIVRTEIQETKNQPTVELLDSRNVIVDPSCGGDYEKANFIGEKFKSSLAALKRDGNYKNLDKINAEAANPIASPDYEEGKREGNETTFNFDDKTRKQFVVHIYWGYWDVHNDGTLVPIVAAWVGDTLIRMEENPFPDRKPPYIITNYMPVRRSVHGEPDGALLEENQKIIGAVTRGVIDLLGKSANSQTGHRKDMLDVTNRRKFNRGENYEFNSNVDPRQGFYTHVYPEVPQSAYNLITMMNNEAESMSGVKAFSSSGLTGEAYGKSVGLGRSALDAASKREAGILRRLADGIIAMGRKIISMNAEFLSEEEVIRVTATEFVTVRRDDLAGNFDLQLTISTPEEDNRKAEELAFMLQTNGPNADPGETRMIRAEIARLRKMPDLAKRIEEYQPQPSPEQIQEHQLKMQHLQAQVAKEQALAMKHAAEAEAAGDRGAKDRTQAILNISKSEEAGGKARDYHSTADIKDLDYLEKSSGADHAKELEKTVVAEKAKAQNKPAAAKTN